MESNSQTKQIETKSINENKFISKENVESELLKPTKEEKKIDDFELMDKTPPEMESVVEEESETNLPTEETKETKETDKKQNEDQPNKNEKNQEKEFQNVESRIHVNAKIDAASNQLLIDLCHIDGNTPAEVFNSRKKELEELKMKLEKLPDTLSILKKIDKKLATPSFHETFEEDEGYISAKLIIELQHVVRFWQLFQQKLVDVNSCFNLLFPEEKQTIEKGVIEDYQHRVHEQMRIRQERAMREAQQMARLMNPFSGRPIHFNPSSRFDANGVQSTTPSTAKINEKNQHMPFVKSVSTNGPPFRTETSNHCPNNVQQPIPKFSRGPFFVERVPIHFPSTGFQTTQESRVEAVEPDENERFD